jgi:FkbM family methyltransferase
MKDTRSQIIDWLKGCKFGKSILDRIILFIYILSSIIILALLYVILGKEKTGKILLSKPKLINWIPIKKVNVNLDGIFLSLPLVMDYMMFVRTDWELEEKKFMKEISKNKGIVLDIGSNIGYHTTMLAKENGNSRIISVEASPTIFKILKENCNANKLTNIIFYNNAVTDQDDIEINFYNRDSMSTTDKQTLEDWSVPESDIKKEKTKTVTIDTLLEREQVNEILLLKMDIEGGEVLALTGAKSSLEQKKIQNMMIEYHSYSNRDYIENLLKKLGYDITLHERSSLYENKDYANGHIFAVLP